jgi:hypothetical protein
LTLASFEVSSVGKSFFFLAAFGSLADQLSAFFSGWCLSDLDNIVYKSGDAEDSQE